MKIKKTLLTGLLSLISISLIAIPRVENVNAAISDFFDSTDAAVNYFQDELPKRITSNFGEHAEKEMHVTWQINKNVNNQYIIYTPYSDITYSQAIKVQAKITKWSLENKDYPYATYLERNICRVDLKDLNPGTKYRYRVGNDDNLSTECYFETATGDNDFTFAIISDPQANKTDRYSQTTLLTNKIISEDKADFLMIGGDISEQAGVEEFYSQFFETQNILTKMPVTTIPGNHEALLFEVVDNGSYYHEVHGEYRAYSSHFYNPSNGPEISLNSTYYYKYNECLFVMINTQFDSSNINTIANWVDETIQNNPSKYVIVMMHRGCYGNHYYGGMDATNKAFRPVFDKHKVDLVMSGHDHTWARTYAYNNNLPQENEVDGTVYWIVGTPGPKLYEPAEGADKQFAYSTTEKMDIGCYSYVSVNEDGIMVTGIKSTGETLDEYFIPVKRDNQGNYLESYETNLSVNVETYGTTAKVDLVANSLNNVDHLILENVDDTDIKVLPRNDMDFTLTDLRLNSTYEYQIRVVYKDGTSKVKQFSIHPKTSLEINNLNQLIVNNVMDDADKYNVYINKVFYKTLFLDEYCQLPNLSKGNYLIEIEQTHNNNVLTKDYIFYKA